MPDQRQWPGLEVIAVERVGIETQFFVPEQFIELLEYRPVGLLNAIISRQIRDSLNSLVRRER